MLPSSPLLRRGQKMSCQERRRRTSCAATQKTDGCSGEGPTRWRKKPWHQIRGHMSPVHADKPCQLFFFLIWQLNPVRAPAWLYYSFLCVFVKVFFYYYYSINEVHHQQEEQGPIPMFALGRAGCRRSPVVACLSDSINWTPGSRVRVCTH